MVTVSTGTTGRCTDADKGAFDVVDPNTQEIAEPGIEGADRQGTGP